MKRGWINIVIAFFVTTIMALMACWPAEMPGYYPAQTPVGDPQVYAALMFDEDFTVRERVLIMEGVEQWAEASNGRIIYEVIDHTPEAASELMGTHVGWVDRCIDVIEVTSVLSNDPRVVAHDEPKTTTKTLGFARHSKCSISSIWLVSDRLNGDRAWRWVAAHEFGHAIGLDHVKNRRAVLYRTFTDISSDCITRWDIEELCDDIVCDLRDTSYCIP